MTIIESPRYRHTYRRDEVALVCQCALRGESLGFVGMASVGKSNMTRFLHEKQDGLAPYLGPFVERTHFPLVDASTWAGEPPHLWQLMLDALIEATEHLDAGAGRPAAAGTQSDGQARDVLRRRLRWLCRELEHRVMFILDNFDPVLESAPFYLIEELNHLRSDGNQERLSYLVITRRLPHVLGRRFDLDNASGFYKLLRQRVFALEPYGEEDARQMAEHLNSIADRPLSARDLAVVCALSGGHAGLLRTIFDVWRTARPPIERALTFCAAHSDVQQECRRILRSLHDDERETALLLARGMGMQTRRALIEHLVIRGLLRTADPPEWFSPVMAEYLRRYDG